MVRAAGPAGCPEPGVLCVFRTEMWTAGLLQWLALVSAVTALVQPAARGELQVD